MTMGKVFSRALAQAGLSDLQERALSGEPLGPAELQQLAAADLLLVAGLADVMRARFRGDEVRLLPARAVREPEFVVFKGVASEHGATGADVLRDLALLRLSTEPSVGVAVALETMGLELAQTALLFGADTLIGDLSNARTLPLLDGVAARQREVAGLIARSGRRVIFGEPAPIVEQRP
jgi:hypothetical protein